MARSPSSLYSSASITAAKTEIIAAEAGTKRLIRKATFTNNSGGVLTVDLFIDPTGAAEAVLADTHSLADMESWDCPNAEGHVLEAAGTMDAGASGAGITLVISGVKVV
jgi:hypothetical protein